MRLNEIRKVQAKELKAVKKIVVIQDSVIQVQTASMTKASDAMANLDFQISLADTRINAVKAEKAYVSDQLAGVKKQNTKLKISGFFGKTVFAIIGAAIAFTVVKVAGL